MSYITTLDDSPQTLAYAEMEEVIKQLPNDGRKLLLREKVKRKIYDCNF